MIKPLLLSALLCAAGTAFAQNHTHEFTLVQPTQKTANSLYNTLKFIDSRVDDADMGFVQTGALNRNATVISTIPVSAQMHDAMGAMLDSSAADGELLYQLRQLRFAEVTGAFNEKGYCQMRLALYARQNDDYIQLARIDTVLEVSGVDVTNKLLKHSSKMLTDLIALNLTRKPEGKSLTLDDVKNVDLIEKKDLPVFTADKFTDGLYTSYASFKQQVPDKSAAVEMKNDTTISWVKAADATGKMIKQRSRDVYAVVHNGKPYIATPYGFYALSRQDNDLQFTGRIKATADMGNVMAGALMFGMAGALLTAQGDAEYAMKIDHVSGNFVRLKKVVR
ncbi:MAG: hypothetical protein INR69_17025 [Mucilaginibacter polytrichastri]|nr:hypothetical protein [Mucilaginibacter polytrichastri]